MLQAVVSLAAVVFVVVNLIADLAYPLLDPRVKLGGEPRARARRRPPLTRIRSDLQQVVSIDDRAPAV